MYQESLIERLEESVLATLLLHLVELFSQIVFVHIKKTLLLDEVAEHQSIEHHGGIPLLLLVALVVGSVIDACDVFHKLDRKSVV